MRRTESPKPEAGPSRRQCFWSLEPGICRGPCLRRSIIPPVAGNRAWNLTVSGQTPSPSVTPDFVSGLARRAPPPADPRFDQHPNPRQTLGLATETIDLSSAAETVTYPRPWRTYRPTAVGNGLRRFGTRADRAPGRDFATTDMSDVLILFSSRLLLRRRSLLSGAEHNRRRDTTGG